MGDPIGEPVVPLLLDKYCQFNAIDNRKVLTENLEMAQDGLRDIQKNFVRCSEMLEIYYCVSHWK